MKRLETILPFNYVHYYAFSIIIGCLAYEINWLFLLYVPFYIAIKRYRHAYLVILMGLVSVGILYMIKTPKPPTHNHFQITDIKSYETYYTYEAKQGIYTYLFTHQNVYDIGDYVFIDYVVEGFSGPKTPNGFNAYNYYASKRIFYKLHITNIKLIKKGFHLNSIKFKLMALFKDYPPLSKQMIYSLIFAHNQFSPTFKENSSLLGVSHLFALSGMHINFLVMGLLFIFKNQKHKTLIVLSILSVYVIIVGFHISLMRAYLMVLFAYVFKKQGITKLDCLALSFMVLFFINPFNRYRLGFILSFLVSLFLIIVPTKKFYLSNIMAYGVSLLFMSNINGGILIISALSSLVYTLLFPIVMMPLVGLSLLPGFYYISDPLFHGFQRSYTFFKGPFIKLPYIGLIGIILYMVFFVYLLLSHTKKDYIKRSVLLICYMCLLCFLPNIDFRGQVIFLDVGQGDSTFIKRPFNGCHLLIDAHKGSSDYIKTLGNITIDYVFITHGDYDHASEALMVYHKYPVKHIYTNPYEYSDTVNIPGIKHTKKGDSFICGDVLIDVLSPGKDYLDDNDNSLVLRLTIDNQRYLFTGDISNKVEADLISYYHTDLKSDYLHISHHGSNYSTSEDFLMYVNPHTAIISVGKNRYNHPHPELIKRLKEKNIKILKTIDENSIIIKSYYYKRKYQLLYK